MVDDNRSRSTNNKTSCFFSKFPAGVAPRKADVFYGDIALFTQGLCCQKQLFEAIT